jgi:hypothetical protein
MYRRVSVILMVFAGTLLARLDARGGELTFTSTTTETHLLELYTSEGCSSCPSAEAWMGKLKSDDRLWQEFVPVAFHVDYWDNLGWKDRFARPAWTQRQRAYANRWGSDSVYTPAFVVDGSEWRNGSRELSFPKKENAGLLKASLNGDTAAVSFQPAGKFSGGSAHLAWLGFSLVSNVKAGENTGRTLRQDFVVLQHVSAPLVRDANGLWQRALTSSAGHAEAGAIACWIESDGVPVQATGGWLSGRAKR